MGRQSRLKQQRRDAHARFTITSPGMLEVLSVGKGDLKITIGDSRKDRADAQELIHEMLRKGYTLIVDTPQGPAKVRRFDPDQMCYIVAGTPDIVPGEPAPEPAAGPNARNVPPRTRPAAKAEPAPEPAPDGAEAPAAGPEPESKPAARRERKVPVKGSKATAIGRTAGG